MYHIYYKFFKLWKINYLSNKYYYKYHTFKKPVQRLKNKNMLLETKETINRMDLMDCIYYMPKEIKHKIIIRYFKSYWKDYFLSEKKIPIWHQRNQLVKTELSKVYLNNVHFLHLNFNTLPENKQYILGCQCSFCINYKETNKHKVNKLLNNHIWGIDDFYNSVPRTESIWNSYLLFKMNKSNTDILYTNKIYDPLFDIFCIL